MSGSTAGLTAGLNVDALKREQLWTALKDGKPEEMEKLIAQGADVNYPGRAGWTLLEKAAYKGYKEIAVVLLQGNADVDKCDDDGWTPLMIAAANGHANIVHECVLADANLHATNKYGRTAAQEAREYNHNDLAVFLETRGSPPPASLPPFTPYGAAPQSVILLAAGLPLQADPQPAYHRLVHNEGLLLTEIGPWMRIAMPFAATHPAIKEIIFTLISHTYNLSITNKPLAGQFFDDFLRPAAQLQQNAIPAQMHALARENGVDYALAPAVLRDTPDHKVDLNQANFLAFMKPEHGHVIEEVLAVCAPTFLQMRREAEVAAADIADPTSYLGTGESLSYTKARVHSLPTLPHVMVAALCVVSTFLFTYLQTTRPDLFSSHPQPTFPTHVSQGLITWPVKKNTPTVTGPLDLPLSDLSERTVVECSVLPAKRVGMVHAPISLSSQDSPNPYNNSHADVCSILMMLCIQRPAVKTMPRMFAKLRDDYADLDLPWAALLDTVRFSLVSKKPAAKFVKQFLPEGVDIGGSGDGGRGIGSGSQSGSQSGSSGDGASSSSSGGGCGDGDGTGGAPAKKRRVEHGVQMADRSLTAVRAKSTMDDSNATVKQELWNLAYTPFDLTFESMLGKGGLEEVKGANRWEEYGDVEWGGALVGSVERDTMEPRNLTTTFKPRNPLFIAALATAKQANPMISPYVWEAALKLLAHPTFASQPVAMVIEVQLYLEEFLQNRKLMHCFYKITRAPNLASLAQDCRKYAKNPELAFDMQKQMDSDAAARAAVAIALDAGGGGGGAESGGGSASAAAAAAAAASRC